MPFKGVPLYIISLWLLLTCISYFQVVCERSEVLALACAVSRAFPLYSRKSSGGSPQRQVVNVGFLLVGGDTTPLTDDDVLCLSRVCEGIRLAQEIVDAPTNEMHTDEFLERIRAVGKECKIEPVIVQGQELEEKGFGGIFGVGKAAVHQPALAVLSYRPEGGGAKESICWVGKGIVYDTGGLSMKTKVCSPRSEACAWVQPSCVQLYAM